MQLKLNTSDRFIANGEQRLTATLVDVSRPVELRAELLEGAALRELLPVSREGASISYVPVLARKQHVRPARLRVRVQYADDASIAAERTLLVLSQQEVWLSQAGLVVVALSTAFCVFVVPQLQVVLEGLEGSFSLPLMGIVAGAVTLLRSRIRRVFELPQVSVSAAILGLMAIALVQAKAELVINSSLDVIPGSVAPIVPGARAVFWGSPALSADLALCQATQPDSCQRFAREDTWSESVLAFLLRHRTEIGCRAQPNVPVEHTGKWREAGRCRLGEGLTISTTHPSRVLHGSLANLVEPQEISVHLTPGSGGLLTRPSIDDLWKLDLTWPPGPQSARAALTLTMNGNGAVRRISATVRGSEPQLLAPIMAAGSGERATVFELETSVGSVALGHSTAGVSDAQRARLQGVLPCWMTPVDSRVAGLVLRGEAVAGWRAVASELVTEIPLCWSGADNPRDAELQLEPLWAPSHGWHVLLPRALMPERLAVIGAAGSYWGRLECKLDAASEWWKIGVLEMDEPRRELRRLKDYRSGTNWLAANEQAPAWFWSCWPSTGEPPAELHGDRRWSVTRRKHEDAAGQASGIYLSHQGKEHCTLTADLKPATRPCTRILGVELERWKDEYMPDFCDRDHTVLCQ